LSWNKTWINVPKVRSIWTSLETHMHVHCLTSLSDFVDAQENNLMSLIWEQRDVDFKILLLRILSVSPPVPGRFELLTFYLSFPLAKSAYRQLSRTTIVEMFILEPAFCLRFVGWKEFLTWLKKRRILLCDVRRCHSWFDAHRNNVNFNPESLLSKFEIPHLNKPFLDFFSVSVQAIFVCTSRLPKARNACQVQTLIFWTRAIKIYLVAVITLWSQY